MPLFLVKQPKCVFVHIPKTGGNSIRNVFFNGQYEGPWFGDRLPDEWCGVFKFGFVRNPFDRVVSAWKMFTEGTIGSEWRLPDDVDTELTLEDVLNIGLDPAAPFGHPRYNQIKPTGRSRLKNHILPQSHPYHGLQFVDYVGRFENLQADFDYVASRLGMSDSQLPMSNWTEREHYHEYFDDHLRRLAEKLYADDLDQFGYQFE